MALGSGKQVMQPRGTPTLPLFFFPLVFFFVNSSQKAEFALVGLKSRHIELDIS